VKPLNTYYANINLDLLNRIPLSAQNVLEIGCGQGEEARLQDFDQRGIIDRFQLSECFFYFIRGILKVKNKPYNLQIEV